ncbi:MAG: phosphoglycerate kinase, partial [Candidatus Limnocylindrus sp.]
AAKPAAKPATKPVAKPAAKPVSKAEAKPVVRTATLVPPKPSAGKPGVNLGAPKMAPSRPANRPQVKPGPPLPPKGATQASGASAGGPSRPANRQSAKPVSKSPNTPATATPVARVAPRQRPFSGGPRRIATNIYSATGKRTIRELDAREMRILLRVDFNVPLSDGKVVDDSRIRATVPTIKALLEDGASLVIASHLGRPDGKVVDGLRLRPAAERLAHHLQMMVPTSGDALGGGTEDAVKRLRPGELLLLENVRFHAGEEKNDPAFAAKLASYADVFVNDAFGAAHRAHASTVGVAGILPSYVGLLMESEVEALSNLLDKPSRPFAAIVGGGKVSGKVAVLEALVQKVNLLILGGGVANTFLVASGRSVGKSLYESKMVEHARRILKLAAERGVKVLLPVDGVVAKEVTRGTEFKVVSTEKLPASWHMVDLGPDSISSMRDALALVKTILWNGPLGVFEIPAFGTATRELAKLAAEKAEAGATVVVGGGDSIAALQQLGLAGKMTHISTGGGASLEYLEGRDLPGLAVIPTAGSPFETMPILWQEPKLEKRPAPKPKAPAKKSE